MCVVAGRTGIESLGSRARHYPSVPSFRGIEKRPPTVRTMRKLWQSRGPSERRAKPRGGGFPFSSLRASERERRGGRRTKHKRTARR